MLGGWPIPLAGLLLAFVVVLDLAPYDLRSLAGRRAGGGDHGRGVARRLGRVRRLQRHFSSYEKTWGTLSAVVITLVWLWLTSAALLLAPK